MKKTIFHVGMPLILTFFSFYLHAQNQPIHNGYRDVKEVAAFLQSMQKENPASITLHKIAVSPGGSDITLLEIGSNLKQVPAIFLGANFEGNTPLATEGALHFARMLLDSSGYTKNTKWFILPLPNPDAASGFFSGLKWERSVNNMDVNNDEDDQTNEDGPDDLNGDGMITRMRVEDPEGTYLISEKDPRLMIKADPKKGERGKYKIYPEGLDNDGDGNYNEDGPGGVNVGISFPHLFNSRDKESGLWPGEAPESYGIMNFIFSHPEIVMVYTLGSSDFCMSPPRNNRTGGASMESLKIPARFANRMGADPEKNYTMAQVMEMFRANMGGGGGREISPEMIAGFLGLGAAVNPLEDDLKFYTDFSEQYKEYLKKKGFSTDRIAATPDKDGSFELWAYYQLGVPSFSMNLFTIPKPPSEKTAENAASPERPERAAQGTGMPRMGNLPAKPADPDENNKIMLSYVDKYQKGSGFVNWTPYTHPTLGKCEIGGFAPYMATTPPAGQIDSLCNIQLPWLLRLSSKIPDIQLLNEKITSMGSGIFKLELFFENKGILPYPIAMGARNRQPAPVIVTLESEKMELLEGFKRTPLGDIGGNQVKKLTWIIRAEKKCILTVNVESAPFGVHTKQIEIGG
jgi:hypothetical protein